MRIEKADVDIAFDVLQRLARELTTKMGVQDRTQPPPSIATLYKAADYLLYIRRTDGAIDTDKPNPHFKTAIEPSWRIQE